MFVFWSSTDRPFFEQRLILKEKNSSWNLEKNVFSPDELDIKRHFDMKFIRWEQKQRRNARLAELVLYVFGRAW